MKALICEAFGPIENLTIKEVESPKAGKGEVVVTVKAAAVNFPDTLIVQGLYQVKPDLPFSPGSDFSGIVKEVGEGVARFKVGDEVIGFNRIGAFAEETVVPEMGLLPKPPSIDFKSAASFLMTYGTSYHALKDRAKLKEGEALVVLGAAGGVGIAAVELAKMMGARVIAAASAQEKLDLCKAYGADEVINYSEEDLKERIKELTNGKGADVIYDPVGGEYTEASIRATAWGGRVLIVGFTAGNIPKIPMNLPLLKGIDIAGVFWGRFAVEDPQGIVQNTLDLVKWFGEGKLKPHIHKVFSLDQALDAILEVRDRKVRGKVVVEIG